MLHLIYTESRLRRAAFFRLDSSPSCSYNGSRRRRNSKERVRGTLTPGSSAVRPCWGKPQAPFGVDEAAASSSEENEMEVPAMAWKDIFKSKAPAPEEQLQTEPAPAEPASDEQKKRAKPQDDTKRTRNSQVKIRLTVDEVAELKAAASAAGMSLADFVMAAAHDRKVIKLPGAIRLRKELIDEGRNLNQALRIAWLERKEGRPADLKAIQAAMAKVEQNLDRLGELILKWDIQLTEQTKPKEVNPDADNQVQGQ